MAAKKTGLVWHERYMWHITGIAAGAMPAGGFIEPGLFHIEEPTSKRRIRNLLEVSGLLDELALVRPRPASEEEILRIHTPGYIERLKTMSLQGHGDAGERAPVGPDSWPIAQLSAGGCIAAADAIVHGEIRNAYALVRPPGHHAERDRGRGFCLLANASIAIEHLRAVHGLRRIAVFDWDVHHGNGVQGLYFDDPNVLTMSVHEESNYPADSGTLAEIGEGRGLGSNINVPLPPGSGHDTYLSVVERVVVPALEKFRPEMVFVASGFDSCLYDPLGRQMAMAETYRLMTRALVGAAGRLCGGRLLMTHEGGYSNFYAPYCGLAVMEELSGIKTEVSDPFGFHIHKPTQRLQPHQKAVIDAAALRVAHVP
ncbi:MAG: class II histone deacetylase [Pseudomonadota bacterium]